MYSVDTDGCRVAVGCGFDELESVHDVSHARARQAVAAIEIHFCRTKLVRSVILEIVVGRPLRTRNGVGEMHRDSAAMENFRGLYDSWVLTSGTGLNLSGWNQPVKLGALFCENVPFVLFDLAGKNISPCGAHLKIRLLSEIL